MSDAEPTKTDAMKPLPRLTPDDCHIYSPEADDDYPPWKQRMCGALAAAVAIAFWIVVAAAIWALWTHPWLIPIIAVPLLTWAFFSSVTHP